MNLGTDWVTQVTQVTMPLAKGRPSLAVEDRHSEEVVLVRLPADFRIDGQLENQKFPAIELLDLGSFLNMQIATLSGGLTSSTSAI